MNAVAMITPDPKNFVNCGNNDKQKEVNSVSLQARAEDLLQNVGRKNFGTPQNDGSKGSNQGCDLYISIGANGAKLACERGLTKREERATYQDDED
jgi:hypothetical protein